MLWLQQVVIFQQTCSPKSVQYIFCMLHFHDENQYKNLRSTLTFLIVTGVFVDGSVIHRHKGHRGFKLLCMSHKKWDIYNICINYKTNTYTWTNHRDCFSHTLLRMRPCTEHLHTPWKIAVSLIISMNLFLTKKYGNYHDRREKAGWY